MKIARRFHELKLLVLGPLVLGVPAFADSVDVFPLSIGLHTVYRFTESSQSWSFGQNTVVQDSGVIECVVLDSVRMNDTTIAWTIGEKRNLVRWLRRNLPPTDTTYVISDSSVRVLNESTTGNHELTSSLQAWSFPLAVPELGSSPVYKFSDSSHVVKALKFTGCTRYAYPTNYDSVWMSSDSGLYARISSRCDDHDEWGSVYWRTFRLLTRTVVSVGERTDLPLELGLLANYPNPFNLTTTIVYTLPNTAEAQLNVYDVLGRQVAVLAEGPRQPGRHEHRFDASRIGSGVYFIRLRSLGAVQTKKVLLLK